MGRDACATPQSAQGCNTVNHYTPDRRTTQGCFLSSEGGNAAVLYHAFVERDVDALGRLLLANATPVKAREPTTHARSTAPVTTLDLTIVCLRMLY